VSVVWAQLLWGALLPAVAAGALLAFAGFAGGRAAAGGWGGALAVGGAYVAGHVGLFGWPSFPPAEATKWFPYLAIAASLVGAVESTPRCRPAVRWLVRLVIGAVALWEMFSVVGAGAFAASLVAVLVFLGSIGVLERRLGRASFLLVLAVTGTAASVAIVLSGSALVAQLGGVLAAALGALFPFALAGWPSGSWGRGVVFPAALVLASLVLVAHFYAELSVAGAVLLGVAPSASWVGEAGPVRRLHPWQAALVRGAAVAVVAGAAVALALWAAPPDRYGY
jgi:hypothetical protein